MTIFFTVMEGGSDKDTPEVAVFESVNNRRAADRRAFTLNRGNPGKYRVQPYKVND